MTRKQRTPEEIIAETEQRLSALRMKQAQKEAASNPALVPLFEQLDLLKKDIREAKKGLGTGPQSFRARRLKHDRWIDKINLAEFEAESTLSSAEQRKVEIEKEIAEALESLSTPSEMSSEA